MTLGVGNIQGVFYWSALKMTKCQTPQKIRKSKIKQILTRVVSLGQPLKYNIIGLFYRTVQYGEKPQVLTPDGLNMTNIALDDLTIAFKGYVGPSGL